MHARVIAASLAAMLVACDGSPPPTGAVYLLDRDPGIARRRVELGGDFRPAFALGATLDDAAAVAVGGGEGVVPPDRFVMADVMPPAGTSVAPGGAVTAVLVVGDTMRTAYPPLADGGTRAILTFAEEEIGRPFRFALTMTPASTSAAPIATFEPVEIPAGTSLHVAVGLRAIRCPSVPMTEVVVTAIEPDRQTPIARQVIDPHHACDEWLPMHASLDEVAGRRVHLRFEARPAQRRHWGRSIEVVVADPALVPSSRADRPPNLVLVSLDTLAAGHLGAYGSRRPTSPRLDRLVEEGTLFTRAVAHYPSTTASHMTMLTGMLPRTHAVRGVLDRLADEVPLLAEILRHAGFVTAAVTEDGAILRSMGFARGFGSYREHRAEGEERSSRGTFGLGARWLRDAPPEPFFLFLHTYETHVPYDPPTRYLRLVRPEGDVGSPDPAWRYDAEIRLLDDALGELLAALAERGVLERSLLVVTSDHGEAFGEHDEWQHGTTLYDEVMHVPLLVRGPGVPPGLRVTDRVGLVDVVPTMLDLLGVPPPPHLQGRSLAGAIAGERLSDVPLVAEVNAAVVRQGPDRRRDLRAVWLGDHKAIVDARRDRWEVFDVARDPAESHDVARSRPDVVTAAAAALAAYDALPVTASPRGAVQPSAVDGLRALGYVD